MGPKVWHALLADATSMWQSAADKAQESSDVFRSRLTCARHVIHIYLHHPFEYIWYMISLLYNIDMVYHHYLYLFSNVGPGSMPLDAAVIPWLTASRVQTEIGRHRIQRECMAFRRLPNLLHLKHVLSPDHVMSTCQFRRVVFEGSWFATIPLVIFTLLTQ